MTKQEKLSVHGLEAEPMVESRSKWIKSGLVRSPIDSLIGRTDQFDPIFTTLVGYSITWYIEVPSPKMKSTAPSM